MYFTTMVIPGRGTQLGVSSHDITALDVFYLYRTSRSLHLSINGIDIPVDNWAHTPILENDDVWIIGQARGSGPAPEPGSKQHLLCIIYAAKIRKKKRKIAKLLKKEK